MGLFDRKPEYLKEHTMDWYYSAKGKESYYLTDNIPSYRNVYFTNFIKSLPNIQELLENGVEIRLSAFGKVMTWLDTTIYTDKYGNKTKPKWCGYDNIFSREKNPFLDFLMRLNHSLTNSTLINIIVSCTIRGCLDFDGEDSWVFDADFWFDENADQYQEFINKLNSFEGFELEPSMINQIVEDGD
ncbi:MAG: hypothetical protein PHX62_00095 [Bacilli bacterium]|nr:hypothetical protein [Bacilli bacterium]